MEEFKIKIRQLLGKEQIKVWEGLTFYADNKEEATEYINNKYSSDRYEWEYI